MKKILAIIFSLMLFCGISQAAEFCYIDKNNQQYTQRDIAFLKREILDLQERKDSLHNIAQTARELNYKDCHIIIKTAQKDWWVCDRKQKENEKLIAEIEEAFDNFFLEKELEYPHATYIWKYFSKLGYNDYVIAGIMGNLMSEVGGQTLNIQYWLYGEGGYYGMCQWSEKYYPEIQGVDNLEEQCAFLENTIKYEIDTFGYRYKKGFNYDAFLALEDERQAAYAFSVSYERCASFSYNIRKSNATKALNYFLG